MARSGGFTGTLDPFGGGSGGLGRYNITGETISSLEETEAYAVAVAWANGQATDAEYLASLQRMVDINVEGSRAKITAQNRLEDAKYTIGRNDLTRDVNNATSMPARTAALKAMLAYDKARLAQMDPGNQAYDDQIDRVAGIRVDMRQAEYSELVDKVNRGRASTSDLLALAKRHLSAAGGDPDADEWRSAVGSLEDRKADELLSDAIQAYQHNRLSGPALIGKLNARMSGLDPDSATYKELARQREDLIERVKDDDAAKRDAEVQGARSSGKISDAKFLDHLRSEYKNAPEGTTEKLQAGNRLREFTFSLAEDKLRYQVTKGTKPIGALISFYTSARATMSPGSERYRTLTLAIDQLRRQGGVGGGGGGGGGGRGGSGGSGGGSGIKLASGKVMGIPAVLQDSLNGKAPPPGFDKLFKIDVTSTSSKRWWDNNLRSMVDAFQDGDREWTYYDPRGNAYKLPFSPDLMGQMDAMNVNYAHQGLARADSAKEAQTWTGRVITASKAYESRGGQYTMDIYEKTWTDVERAKEKALAGGRYAEYTNLVREQAQLTRYILGIDPSQPLDIAYASNPVLTAAQRGRIAANLDKLAPRNLDENSPYYKPDGDAVLGMIQDGGIQTTVDAGGVITSATLDENRGYLTQTKDGSIVLQAVDMTDPGQQVYDPAIDAMVPAYLQTTAPVSVRWGGEDVVVRQPVVDGGVSLPVFATNVIGAGQGALQPQGGRQPWQRGTPSNVAGSKSIEPYIVGGNFATLGVRSITTYEQGKAVQWLSLDGTTWLRHVPDSGMTPRIVLQPGVTYDPASSKWTHNGKEVTGNELTKLAKWWGPEDVNADGRGWGIGAPGKVYTTRTAGADGTIDARPEWVILTENKEWVEAHARRGAAMSRTNLPEDPIETAMTAREDERGYMATGASRVSDSARDRFLTEADQRAQGGRREPGRGAGSSWDRDMREALGPLGELIPSYLRVGASLLSPKRQPIDRELGQKELGLKHKPSPTLRPAPTPQLAPLALDKNTSVLKPVKVAKLVLKPKPKPKPKQKAPTSGTSSSIARPTAGSTKTPKTGTSARTRDPVPVPKKVPTKALNSSRAV